MNGGNWKLFENGLNNDRRNTFDDLKTIRFDIAIPQSYEPLKLSLSDKFKSAEVFYKKAKEYYKWGYYNQAFTEFRKAQTKGYPNIKRELDVCYLQIERSKWIKYYESLAEKGNVDAQYKLGRIWEDGEEVAKNDDEAEKWYEKAAEQGHPTAQYLLGRLFHKKRSLTVDYLHYAYYWLHKAVENGCSRAEIEMHKVQARDFSMVTNKEAWKLWFKAIDASYQNNEKLYHEKCVAAADKGCSAAAYCAGRNYQFGYGCNKDSILMRMYYVKAAEQGNDAGMIALAYCYSEGDGVEKDDAQFYYWAKRAQECNTYCGYTVLGRYYMWKKENDKGNYYLETAAKGGDPEAMFELGRFREAAAKGFIPAKIMQYGEGYYDLTYTFGPAIWFMLNNEWVNKFKGEVYIESVGTKHGDMYDSQMEMVNLYAWLYDIEDEGSARIFENVMSITPDFKDHKLQFVRYKHPVASYHDVDQYRLVFKESLPIPIHINSENDLQRFFSTFSECLKLYLGDNFKTTSEYRRIRIWKA